MKRSLLLTICALMISNAAMADTIGIYNDANGSSCYLGNIAGQFSSSATIIHKFTSGATGSRFKVTFPAGSAFFGFNTPYVTVGSLTSDLSVGYGHCFGDCIVLGNILAIYGTGPVRVQAAEWQTSVIYTNCLFAELPAIGGTAYVGVSSDCEPIVQRSSALTCGVIPVEQSTWGSVKALYR